jgi:hypothetical protein
VTSLSPQDRRTVVRVLQAAQVAYALAHFPKKQVLDGAGDQRRLHESVAATRAAVAELSAALRDRTNVKWKDLIADAVDDEAAWRIAKRVVPTLFSELRPLVADEPEAAFLPAAPTKSEPRSTERLPTKAGRET